MRLWLLTLLIVITLCFVTNNAKDIRFCSIGMGVFGKVIAKLAIEKGFKMVAAFTRYSKHTKSVGELLEMTDDESLSFLVSDMNNLEEIIDKTKPDFCIDATNKTLKSVYPHFVRLITKKINIVTINDEAVYPDTRFNLQTKQIYKALNTLCKQNNVVIVGGGYSDSIFLPVIPSIAASMKDLSKIELIQTENIDDWGEFAHHAQEYGVGLTENEFKNKFDIPIDERYLIQNWQRRIVEAIGDSMNYPILELEDEHHHKSLQLYTRKECYKVNDENGIYSKVINKTIPFGDCGGMNSTILGKSDDGVKIMFSLIFAVQPNIKQIDDVKAKLYGNPDIEFAIKNVNGYITTAASLIHRVPMVLNELKPGFYNVARLNANKYWRHIDDIDWSDYNHNDANDKKDL